MKMKNKMLALLTLACACTLTTGVVVAGAQENAGEPATQNTSVFKVLDGASIKLSDIDESYGIKFIAEVGETDVNATYNFMIAPAYLVDVYENDDAQDKANLVDYIKAYAESKGGEVAIVENCPVGEVQVNETTTVNGIYGAIVDLYWLNLNRDFVGIAYTTDAQGAVTRVADLADDGARSIAYVAENTTGAEFEEVTAEIALNAEKSANGVVADAETDETLVKQTSLFNRTETIVNGIDDTYGAYWGFQYPSGDGNTEWKIDTDTLAKRLVGYEKVSFSIYNPYGAVRPIYINTGSDWGGTTLYNNVLIASESWQEFSISVSDLTSVYVVMGGTNVAEKTVKFSQFKAYTKVEIEAQLKAQAAEVVALINALPAVEELTLLDGGKIKEANEAFNALPTDVQALVTNVETLQAAATAWNAKFVLLDASYSLNTTYTLSGNATLSNGVDETYGEYLNVKYTGASGEIHAVAKYAIEDLATKLEGFDAVVFYVWTDGKSRPLMCNFGGSLKTSYGTILQNTWTKVEVPVADFISGSYFGALNAGYGTLGAEYKFTSFVGMKVEKVEVEGLKVFDMSSTNGFTINTSYTNTAHAKLSVGVDATYGNYLNVQCTNGSDSAPHTVVKYALSEEMKTALAGYDEVVFYVNFVETRTLMANFGGSLNASYKPDCTGGEWVEVRVPVADFLSGSYFGIFNAYYKTRPGNYKFSAFTAVKAEA